MKKRIMAEYLIKVGYNKMGERDVNFDKYKQVEVKTVEDARILIAKRGPDGEGTITEQYEDMYFVWCDVATHHVSGGFIYKTENY